VTHRRLAAAASLAVGLYAFVPATDAVEWRQVKPYSDFALKGTGSVLVAVGSTVPNPYVTTAVYLYKGTEFGLDVAETAVDRHSDWLTAEIHAVDEKAARLREIKAQHGDLHGEEARDIRKYLAQKTWSLGNQQEDPILYTFDAIREHWVYVSVHMGLEELKGKAFKKALVKLGIYEFVRNKLPLPQKVQWALNYGGPLEKLQRAQGWQRLDLRAAKASKAADKQLVAAQKKLAAALLAGDRVEELKKAATTVLDRAYLDALEKNPSRKLFPNYPSDFRLIAARAVEYAFPAPVAASPAAAVAVPISLPKAREPDRLVQAIVVDNTMVYEDPVPDYGRSTNVPIQSEPEPAPPEPEPEEDETPSRPSKFHEELMRVGDGKTFAVCSDGCPSDSSWDGQKGQTLYGR
jgi:hypothetical protein